MNLIVLKPSDVSERGRAILSERATEHVTTILNRNYGDTVKVGILNAQKGLARIIERSDSSSLYVQLLPLGQEEKSSVSELTEEQMKNWLTPMISDSAIDVVLAMPRPRVFERLIQILPSLRIGHLFIYPASKSELAFFSSPKLSLKGIEQNLLIGIEQAGTTIMPAVTLCASWSTAQLQIFRFLKKSSTEGDHHHMIIAHPYSEIVNNFEIIPKPLHKSDLAQKSLSSSDMSNLAILVLGPEAGFIPQDISDLWEFGTKNCTSVEMVSLGSSIMRCEVAVQSLIAQIQLLIDVARDKNVITRNAQSEIRNSIWIQPKGRKI